MDTSNLIPIEFVKTVTPLVAGDKVYAKGSSLDEITDPVCWNDKSYDHEFEWFLVSFAERPNDGDQPVGDDVITHCFGDGLPTVAFPAAFWQWDSYASAMIKSWIPKYESMLAEFKKTQCPAEDLLDAVEWPNEGRIDIIGRNGNDGEHYTTVDVEWDGEEELELGMIYTSSNGLTCSFVGSNGWMMIGRPVDSSVLGEDHLTVSEISLCRKIMTDRERLAKEIRYILMLNEVEDSRITSILLDFENSDKFTTTLTET